MSSSQQHPKFLMQVKRQQPVPKLISINDIGSSSATTHKKDRLSRGHNASSQQKPQKHIASNSRQQQFAQVSRSNAFYGSQSQVNYNTFTSSLGENTSIIHNDPTPPSIFYTTARKQLPVTEARNYRLEVIQLEKLLQIQRQEKLELQQIIKQLTVQSEKLKQVNDHIVDRLKELQKSFVEQKANQEREQDERVRKVISQVYRDVEQFLRSEIQTLTHKLRGQRMSPLLQKKLELFMQSMLQINQNTVEMHKISQKRYSLPVDPLAGFISEGYRDDKENSTVLDFSRRVNVLFDSKSKNESFVSRSSNRGEKSSAGQSDKRLINKVYVSSNRKQSPSRVLFDVSSNRKQSPVSYNRKQSPSRVIFDTGNNQSLVFKQLNQPILEQNYLQTNQVQTFRENFHTQKAEGIPVDHIEFINPFSTNQFQGGSRYSRIRTVGDAPIDKRQYFESSNYDESNFHIKEYTPNKRRKIFEEGRTREKRYETRI